MYVCTATWQRRFHQHGSGSTGVTLRSTVSQRLFRCGPGGHSPYVILSHVCCTNHFLTARYCTLTSLWFCYIKVMHSTWSHVTYLFYTMKRVYPLRGIVLMKNFTHLCKHHVPTTDTTNTLSFHTHIYELRYDLLLNYLFSNMLLVSYCS